MRRSYKLDTSTTIRNFDDNNNLGSEASYDSDT